MELLNIYPKGSRVLFIGTYPPPLGGVSVHIKRLTQHLKKKGCQTNVFDATKLGGSKTIKLIKLFKLLTFHSFDIVHIHVSNPIMNSVLFLLKYVRGYKLYFSYHNSRLFENPGGVKDCFPFRLTRYLDFVILVSDQIFDGFKKSNIRLPRNVLVKQAFLPPDLEEEAEIIQSYTDDINSFIGLHKPLIIANASKIVFYKNTDLYGLDLCIELTHRLKQKFPNIGLLFALADGAFNTDYLTSMKNKISEIGIENNFHFMAGQKDLWPLFKKSDLCVRPTITDGDAVSIREALYLKCPVVASDAAKRPNGVITFKSRDIDDFYLQSFKVLCKIKI